MYLHTHIKGTTFFDLNNGKGSIIFLSPTLRHIHLACTDLVPSTVRYLQNSGSGTPLESLVFEECNIDATALKLVLSKPEGLRRLTLGERIYHFHDNSAGHLTGIPEKLADALSPQAASLEYLSQTQRTTRLMESYYFFPAVRSHLIISPYLAPLPMLKELDIPYGSPLSSITAILPPGLEKIRLHNVPRYAYDGRDILLLVLPPQLRLFEHKCLKHLELVLQEARTERDDTQEEWLDTLLAEDSDRNPWRDDEDGRGSVRENIWAFGWKLRNAGIRLTVRWIRSAGYIPPFMYGEILPVEFGIYDSNRPDIFGSVEMGKWFTDAQCSARIRASPVWEDVYGVKLPDVSQSSPLAIRTLNMV